MAISGTRSLLSLAMMVTLFVVSEPREQAPASATAVTTLAATDDGLDVIDLRVTPSRLDRTIETAGFAMVGLTWLGSSPVIRVRVRAGDRWRAWRTPAVLGDGPDRRSREGEGRNATALLWVGPADAIQIDVLGSRPRDLRLTLMQADDGATSRRAAAAASASPGPTTPPQSTRAGTPTSPPRPQLRGRRKWGADPRLRDGRATFNRTIQQVHLHHTASSNRYTAGQVPGILRGIYRYHTVNLGWSDIGYNFLVDRFGRTWVGRAGGAKRPVRGAHTLGFNSTSTGIAVIGNYEVTRPSRKVRTALVRLMAWKLARYDRHAAQRVLVYSHGSDKQPAGRKYRLPTIDGHRDTNATACPGEKLYDRLRGLRKRTGDRVRRFS